MSCQKFDRWGRKSDRRDDMRSSKNRLSAIVVSNVGRDNGPCHVSGIFLPLRVKSLPLATIYEVKIPLRKWKKSLLQRNPAQMTSANDCVFKRHDVI
jgi:hypothetical protein